MKIDIMTLFPQMFEPFIDLSIIGRAIKKGAIEIKTHQIRDFAFDKHQRVDDVPYGPGDGMLMIAEPIAMCFENICKIRKKKPRLIYMTPTGQVLTQQKAKELSGQENLSILCGHYEGIDQRVLDEFVDEEISIGDYVLTGGELPALVLMDSIARLVPGVLKKEECFLEESHSNYLLEHPQYTKPAMWRGREVPEILLSGHHEKIKKWKMEESLKKTKKVRPDLLEI